MLVSHAPAEKEQEFNAWKRSSATRAPLPSPSCPHPLTPCPLFPLHRWAIMSVDSAEEVQALLNDVDGNAAACSADDLFKQAVKNHEAGEWALALWGFATVLRLEPGRADAAFNIAATLQMLGFTRLAVEYTEKVSLWRTDLSWLPQFIFSSRHLPSLNPTHYRPWPCVPTTPPPTFSSGQSWRPRNEMRSFKPTVAWWGTEPPPTRGPSIDWLS